MASILAVVYVMNVGEWGCSSEEDWQDTTDEQLEMDSVFSPQDVGRKSSGNSIRIKNRSSTPRKLQEPSIKVFLELNYVYILGFMLICSFQIVHS